MAGSCCIVSKQIYLRTVPLDYQQLCVTIFSELSLTVNFCLFCQLTSALLLAEVNLPPYHLLNELYAFPRHEFLTSTPIIQSLKNQNQTAITKLPLTLEIKSRPQCGLQVANCSPKTEILTLLSRACTPPIVLWHTKIFLRFKLKQIQLEHLQQYHLFPLEALTALRVLRLPGGL